MAMRGIRYQLEMMDAKQVVISCNLHIRADGLPYAQQREPDDTGVAVYFMLDGIQQCIPCDRWAHVWENMRAIEKTIEAQRGIERWGTKAMVTATFSGYKALPAAIITPAPSRQWYDVLGVSNTATKQQIKVAYQNLAKAHHPDSGGTNDYFVELTKAYNLGMGQANG
jgi:hypothetical protein